MATIEEVATPEALSRILGLPVQSVARGPIKALEQSDVVVVTVTYGPGGSGSGVVQQQQQQQFLLKHVDVPAQKARINKTEEKWAISVRSFQNEFQFFFGHGGHVGDGGELRLPRCYFQSRLPVEMDRPLERSTLLLEYLAPEEYEQHQDLTLDQAKAALEALAYFHAFHWDGRGCTIGQGLFERGGWWRTELRPSVKFHTMVESFESLCRNFPAEFADVDNAESRALLLKLQQHYGDLDRQLWAKGDRTLMHGDCKTSNLFFRRRGVPGRTPAAGECSLIDFQWTGAASSGGGDVAYLLWSGVEPAAILAHEAALLDHYHAAFTTALPCAAEVGYARSEFQRDYELELLDVFKTCLPQLLNGLTPEACREHLGEFGWLTHEYFPAVTRAFVGRALAVLRTWEPGV